MDQVKEDEENKVKDTENIFNVIIREKIPNLKEEVPFKLHEEYRTPVERNRKSTPQDI